MEEEKVYTNIVEFEYNYKLKMKIIISLLIIFVFLLILLLCLFLQIVRRKQESEKFVIQLEEYVEEQRQEEEETAKEAEEAQAKIPKLTEEGRTNISSIYRSETKRAFLTFDDGPSTNTRNILQILNDENIQATFFVLGTQVEAMPEVVKEIYDEGHYIANHGYSHKYSEVYSSSQAVLDEFNKCNDAVKKAIGVEEYNSHLFRFPGGYAGGPYATEKEEASEILSENDIVYVDWNCLSGDAETTNPTVEFEIQRIQETSQNKNSLIILMHDSQTKQATVEALPQIITYLREQGYEFKSFYDIIK